MKQLLFATAMLFCATTHAQCTDYVNDSLFTALADDRCSNYVTISPVLFDDADTAMCTMICITEMKDFGTQPYGEGFTKSGAVFYTIRSVNEYSKHQLSLSINNINSTDYDCYRKYGWKFLYWRISENHHLTIQ